MGQSTWFLDQFELFLDVSVGQSIWLQWVKFNLRGSATGLNRDREYNLTLAAIAGITYAKVVLGWVEIANIT